MREGTVSLRQAAYAFGAFAALVVVGTIGFMLIVGESMFDALYRTVITVYTAGLVSPPETFGAKLFTLVLVVWGVAVFLYVFGLVIELTVRGAVSGAWQERRTRRRVEELRDHYIICGYGRVGRRIAAEFRETGAAYVVVDFSPDAVEAARRQGDLLIEGRGTEDATLEAAGLAGARGLVASSDSDADNLYITLSARAAREDLLIVARAADESAAAKLKLAGANRVVQPYATAGHEMAKLMLRPQVAAFLDVVSTVGGPDLLFEEIEVTRDCGHAGKSLRELQIRERTGSMVVAVRRRTGVFDTNPAPELPFEAGDVMIAVGTSEEIRALEELFAREEQVAR